MGRDMVRKQQWIERNRDRVAAYSRKWQARNKDKVDAATARYAAVYPERAAAKRAVYCAVSAGTLVPSPCWVCGVLKTEAHHVDYSTPLSVVWLCRKHHRQLHAEFHQEQK